MAGAVANIKVCSPYKLRISLTGKYHAICHYLYNLPLAVIENQTYELNYYLIEQSNKKMKEMKIKTIRVFTIIVLMGFMYSCQKQEVIEEALPTIDENSEAYRITKNISYNNVNVDVIIDKPINDVVDVLVVYHGTATLDSKILEAANKILDNFKDILDRQDMMIMSVVYPEENILFGDNILEAEAALLWVKNEAAQDLGITIEKIFLGGHSQGGYLVTRLNTLHETNGVIASAPGPLNLKYRCQLEEDEVINNQAVCTLLKNEYGTTVQNPNEYTERSLLNYTNEYKSDILFVQGLQDSYLQMYSWPLFKQQITDCTNCQITQFLELPDYGHPALFQSPDAKLEFNTFIYNR
jgi:hypothetical protein